jgi:flagellum-specific peptidoglycan hydrolase FlgJ
MAHLAVVRIGGSVGRGGVNRWADVAQVQQLLNEHRPLGIGRLAIDGDCGPLTERAIERWQAQLLHMRKPDGRVDPHGPTLQALNRAEQAHRAPRAVSVPPRNPPTAARPSPAPTRAVPPATTRTATPSPRQTPAGPSRGRTPPETVVAAAQASQQRWNIPASVTLAQWALESGWGRSMPHGSNNPFGIKARRGEPAVDAATDEVIGGRRIRINAGFRKFASLADAFDHHGRLLATGRPYARARGMLPDPDRFADALTGVYATDPRYGTKLKSMMRSNDFYRFNR